jgi:magnesium-transporting ATPase (P-type)
MTWRLASEHDFEFAWLGLVGLSDPLRAEIPQAVAAAYSAGIQVIMITGDYPATARVIANQAACLALVPMLFALPPLLMPLHIAFENEPADSDVMQRPPRDRYAPLFGTRAVLGALGLTPEHSRAMVFTTLVMSNIMLMWVNRTQAGQLMQGLSVRNEVSAWVMGCTLAGVLLCLYVPWFAQPLGDGADAQCAARIKSAAFSAIMRVGALVLPNEAQWS